MRSWASVGFAIVACRSPAPPPKQALPRAHPRACAKLEARCDRAIEDAAAFAVVQRRCWGCHAAGGIAGHDFRDVAALRAAPIADMIGGCQMPPDGEPALPDADRRLLIEWSTCK